MAYSTGLEETLSWTLLAHPGLRLLGRENWARNLREIVLKTNRLELLPDEFL